MNSYQIQKHKQISVNNAMVSSDAVKIKAGKNYINWIPITKDKLQVIAQYVPFNCTH